MPPILWSRGLANRHGPPAR